MTQKCTKEEIHSWKHEKEFSFTRKKNKTKTSSIWQKLLRLLIHRVNENVGKQVFLCWLSGI